MFFKSKSRKEIIIILIRNFNYFKDFKVNNINYYILNKNSDIKITNNYIKDRNIKKSIIKNLNGYNKVTDGKNIAGARIYFIFFITNIFFINTINFN